MSDCRYGVSPVIYPDPGSVVASDLAWYTAYCLFYFTISVSGSTAVLNVLNKGKCFIYLFFLDK